MKNVTSILFDKDVVPYVNTMRWMTHNDVCTFDRCEFLLELNLDIRPFTNLGPVNSVGATHQYKDNIEWNW